MHSFRTRRSVPYSPAQMYALVAKVEDYPQFLPLCQALVVRAREATGAREVLVADMTVAYGPVRETFTSRVTLDPAGRKVLVEYLDGPFRHLENRWTLLEAERGGCEVDFFISYEFRSRTLQLLMGAMFDRAFARFAQAFEDRARQVYGDPGGGSIAAQS